MDKRTVKSIIIELKNDGYTYQAISDILATEYNVSMSRQAVCGMYKRITSDENIENNQSIILATTDIVNYSVIGVDNNKIKQLLLDRGITISLARLKSIIEENLEYTLRVYNGLLEVVKRNIKIGEDIEYIKKAISYKGELPSDKVMNQLLLDYATNEIQCSIANVSAEVLNITENKNLVKQISERFNTNLSTRELGRALNI